MKKETSFVNVEKFLLYCEKGKVSKCVEIIDGGLDINSIYEDTYEILDIALTKILINLFQTKKSSFKAARLRRCLEYLLNIKVDYSKCYISFFTATCLTFNFDCSDKLLQNGFDVNQEYKGNNSYFNHILNVSLLRYGKFVKKKKKDKNYNAKMETLYYLLEIKNVEYSRCLNSVLTMMKNNQTTLLDILINKGIDLNQEIENTILIDKMFMIELESAKKKNVKWLQSLNVDYHLCIETMNKICNEKNEKLALFFIANKIDLKSLHPENEIWVCEQLLEMNNEN